MRIRTQAEPRGLPFSHDATSLAAAEVWNLICANGEFDISFHPAGFASGYAQLAPLAPMDQTSGFHDRYLMEISVAHQDQPIKMLVAATIPARPRIS